MKWKQSKANRDCAHQPLTELVHDELDEKQCEQVASHLNDCETCQQRLTLLTADSQWWLDASRWLDPAAGSLDPCGEDRDDDDFMAEEWHYSDPQQELLTSGLLAPSEETGVVGTLGRYAVHGVIGAGGTGIVLKALDIELNRTVAIKVLSPVVAVSGAARRRFAREGQAVAAVAHENVVAVHHVEGGGKLPFLVMQYIDGDSLQNLVVRDGPLEIVTALRMTAQIASALSAAHDQGLVHRDVKPANILVGAAGQRVWITDFGLARAVDDASLTRTGFIAGTPHYMSPEQARGETVRGSSDLFGLGSVLYFMLTGRPPFRAERTLAILNRICNEPHRPVREVNPDVPPAIADLVDRLLDKSAAHRIASASMVRIHCLHLLAALTEPDGDLSRVQLTGSSSASADLPADRLVPRPRFRIGGFAVAGLLTIGVAIAIAPTLRSPGQAVLAYSRSSELVAGAKTKQPAPESVSVAEPSSDATFIADNSSKSGATMGPSAAVATESVVEAPIDRATVPNATDETNARSSRRGRSSTNAGPGTATTSPETDPTLPPWGQPQLAEPPVRMAEAFDAESSSWETAFDQLQASFDLFQSQSAEPSSEAFLSSDAASPLVPDPFLEQLRSMIDILRTLEQQPVLTN